MQLIVLSEIKYRFRLEKILQLDPLLSVQATQTIPDSGIRDKFQLLALWQLNPSHSAGSAVLLRGCVEGRDVGLEKKRTAYSFAVRMRSRMQNRHVLKKLIPTTVYTSMF